MGQCDEDEPAEIAVEVLGGNALKRIQEVLPPGVTATDCLNVEAVARADASRDVEGFMTHPQIAGTGRIGVAAVGDRHGIRCEQCSQRVAETLCGHGRQHFATSPSTVRSGNQQRNPLLPRSREGPPCRRACAGGGRDCAPFSHCASGRFRPLRRCLSAFSAPALRPAGSGAAIEMLCSLPRRSDLPTCEAIPHGPATC